MLSIKKIFNNGEDIMNKISEYQDKYNPNKIWIIKKTPCGHYYINQKICGKLFYSSYRKVTLNFIRDILE